MRVQSTFLSITTLSLIGIAFGISLMNPPLANASETYDNHLPIIGIDVNIPIQEKHGVHLHFRKRFNNYLGEK